MSLSRVNHMSRLDYLIVDHQVFNYVLEMEIDEERTLCPFHKKKKKKKKKKNKEVEGGGATIVYSDHNPIICKFKFSPSKVKLTKEPRWVITSKGLDKFKEETTNFTQVRGYAGLEKAILKKMDICFRKVWKKQTEEEVCCTRKQLKLLKLLYEFKKKGKAQRAIIKKYIKKTHSYIAEKI